MRYKLICILLLLPLISTAQNTRPDDEESAYYILSGEADKAIKDGDYHTAIERIKEAMDIEPLNPANVMLLSNLGMMYNYLDQDTLALQAYDRALQLAPSMTVVLVNRGSLRLKMGSNKEAYDDFTTAIERDSCNTTARYYHGLMSLYGGDRATAEADFEVLRNADPDSYNTNVAMSTLYSMTGRDRDAIPYYHKLIADDPAAEYYAALAGCYLALDELAEASSILAEAIEKYPRDPELYYYRAWLNRDRYLLKEAKADAQAAISLGMDRKRVEALFSR